MKTSLLVLTLFGLATAAFLPAKSNRKLADTEFLKRQQDILKLLFGVGHDSTFTSEFADYELAEHLDQFTEPRVVKEFEVAYRYGFLSKDAVFSMGCKKTFYQTKLLFDLFFYAKNFDTFYKVASWARTHIQGTQFVYALYTSIYHRPDCRGLQLPPIYELFPTLYVPSEYLHKVYDAKIEGRDNIKIYLNNSGWEDYYHKGMHDGVIASPLDTVDQNSEERLSYFREDLGLSDYFTQLSAFYPAWLNQQKYSKVSYFRRGEAFYYVLQQLYARYALERIANKLPVTDLLYFDRPIKTGYNSRLTTFNGHNIFPRADNTIPEEFNPMGVWTVNNIEHRIIDAIDQGLYYFEKNTTWENVDDAIDLLGNIVLGTPESSSRRYYDSYFFKSLQTLGYLVRTGSDNGLVSSAIGNLLTTTRDPAFYSLLHRLMLVFQRYKAQKPVYTTADLGFDGVKIDDFEVDKLVTYFDRFDFDIANAVPAVGEKTYKDLRYIARQFRINHKPFTYKLTVSSDEATDAIVRVFVGPKYDALGRELTFNQARLSFVEFDRFPAKLTVGKNYLERNSKESSAYVEDAESIKSFYSRVKNSVEKQDPFYITDSFRCGMPERLLLPKGSRAGRQFVFYAIVSTYEEKVQPVAEERFFDSYVLCGGSRYYDGRAQGFPFDRMVHFDQALIVPNAYLKTVTIYHKMEADVNRLTQEQA